MNEAPHLRLAAMSPEQRKALKERLSQLAALDHTLRVEGKDELVEHMLVGAMSVEGALTYFRRARWDAIAALRAALAARLACFLASAGVGAGAGPAGVSAGGVGVGALSSVAIVGS